MIKQAARFMVLLVLSLIAVPLSPADAQGTASPPSILVFESDVDSAYLADVESGAVTATLRWEILGLRADHRVVLFAYQINAWVPLSLPDDTALQATGAADVVIAHPFNFGPPTYKLAVLDPQNRALDERTLTIPFAGADDGSPALTTFSTAASEFSANELAARAARVSVLWSISERQPHTNPVFEQVMPDGSTVNVELPRPNVWIPSTGTGQLAPMLPPGGGPVVLQVRLIDVRDGSVIDQRTLLDLPVIGTAVPVPVQPIITGGIHSAAPTEPAGAAASSQPSSLSIDYFSAGPSPIMRGGTVTVSWQVTGAFELSVWRLTPSGELAEAAPSIAPASSWTVTLDPEYTSTAGFVLFASDSQGRQAQKSVIVRIECGMLYFFGIDSQGGCPAGDARTVLGSFQAFQYGYMLSRSDTGEIFVLFDGGQLSRYRDTWRGEAIAINQAGPSGTIPAQRAFGKVWTENQVVQIKLGWPTAPEVSYTMRYQPAITGRVYVNLPNGTILFLADNAWDTERRID